MEEVTIHALVREIQRLVVVVEAVRQEVQQRRGTHLLTVPEAAVYLRSPVGTLREWIRTGKLDGAKTGKRRVFTKEELDQFVATRRRRVRPAVTSSRRKQKPEPPQVGNQVVNW
jgi:excisionase family DNA binding protein